LWAEPEGENGHGSSGTVSVRKGIRGEKRFEKVRRFVIINAMDGHCICLPIMTYGGQGVNKKGVHARHHAVIYSTEEPVVASGEKEKGMTKRPIRVTVSSPRHKLDSFSRINYAKPYTVEHNVKVWFIGRVHKNSEWQLGTDYNEVHPPLQARGVPPQADNYFTNTRTSDSANPGGSSSWESLFPEVSYPSASSYSIGRSTYSGVATRTDVSTSWAIGTDPFNQTFSSYQPSPFHETEVSGEASEHGEQDQDNERGLQNAEAPENPENPDEEYQHSMNEDLLYDDLDIYEADA
jgi:hypothetical protein